MKLPETTAKLIALLAISTAAIGCSQDKTVTQSAVIERGTVKQPHSILNRDGKVVAKYGDFEIANFGERKRYRNDLLTGVVKNTSNRAYDYTQITVRAMDESGREVETLVANRAGLGPGKTWKFQVKPINPDAIKTYKVESVAGW